jgi:transposase-like protein
MAIVWHANMTAHEYAAAGNDLEVPRPNCPECVEAMVFWGSYFRPVRIGSIELQLRVRRAICKSCRSSHALLPDLVAVARFDAIEAIGRATVQMANGTTAGEIARRTSVPYSTVRDWRRRFAARAKSLSAGLLAATVALGDLVPRLPAGEVNAALKAVSAVAAAARRRFRITGSDWTLANLVAGGHLFSAKTDPPWIAA